VTWGYLKTLFYDMVADDEGSPAYWTGDMVLQYAQHAVRELVEDTNCLEKREAMEVTASQHEYDYPSDAMQLWRVTFDRGRLRPITKQRLRMNDEEWEGRTGTPKFYYLDEDTRKIGLYEAPAEDSTAEEGGGGGYGVIVGYDDSGEGVIVDITDATPIGDAGVVVGVLSDNFLEVFYWAEPPDLDDLEDVPVPQWAASGILYGMLADAMAADTMQGPKPKEAAFWRMMFDYVKQRLQIRSNDKVPISWVMNEAGDGARSIEVLNRLPDHIPEPS